MSNASRLKLLRIALVDVPALILVAIIFAVLMPRTATVAVQTPRTAQA